MTQLERARHVPVYPTELVQFGARREQPAIGRRALRSRRRRALLRADVSRSSRARRTPCSCTIRSSRTSDRLHRSSSKTSRRSRSPVPRDEPTSQRTRVVAIHPTAEEVPRNLLRFYLHFSSADERRASSPGTCTSSTRAPASRCPERSSRWSPSSGTPNERASRCSSIPPRIKRGLAPHREAGYPLREGATIEVVVDAGFADAHGRPLAERVLPPLPRGRRRPPARRARRVGRSEAPAVGHARSARRSLRSPARPRAAPPLPRRGRRRRHARARAGSWSRRASGRGRSRRWRSGATRRYALVVDTTLEDLAGNSVARVFDRDLADPDHDPIAASERHPRIPPT